MRTCMICGARGLFLHLSPDGICKNCLRTEKKFPPFTAKTNASNNIQLSITTNTSSYSVEIKQRTPGILPAVSSCAWDGYVSPSGGYVNFAHYQVTGINPSTNRKNKRKYEAFNEADAVSQARAAGLISPFEIKVLPSKEPSEQQLSYAQDLEARLPNDACYYDVSAIISRITDGDESPAPENLMRLANEYEIKCSRFHGSKAIMDMAKSLPLEQYKEFRSRLR